MTEDTLPLPPGEPSARILNTLVRSGHLLLMLTLTAWVVMYFWKGDPYDETWQIILLTAFFGRAAAVGAGLSNDFHPVFLFYQAVATDLILVLYLFPAFVRGYQRLAQVRYVGAYLMNAHKVALRYKSRMAPYGMAGLLVFVIFPFWSTGPLVGSIVGYLLGLPSVGVVLTVTIGNILACAAWVWFYDWLNDWNPGVAMALLVLIFAMAITGFAVAAVRRKKKDETPPQS